MQNKTPIIFENNDYIIVDKPAGITVNRSDTTSNEITLQDLVEEKVSLTSGLEDKEFNERSGIVHRLDKETSGVIIVAKNPTSFRKLQQGFKDRVVEKKYLALVHGQVVPSSGEISVPVGRLPWNRKRFGVLAGGREAVTFYQTVAIYESNSGKESLSLLELKPKTGRTHQIRVHLKYINHPIFADPLYGGRKTSRDDRKLLPRVFLHAKEISFEDPKTGQGVSYESQLPRELKDLLEKLKVKTDNS